MEYDQAHDEEAQKVLDPAAGVDHDSEYQEVHADEQRRIGEVPQLSQDGAHVLGSKVLGGNQNGELPPAPRFPEVGRRGRRPCEVMQTLVSVAHRDNPRIFRSARAQCHNAAVRRSPSGIARHVTALTSRRAGDSCFLEHA